MTLGILLCDNAEAYNPAMSQLGGHLIPFGVVGVAMLIFGAYLLLFVDGPTDRRWLGWIILTLGLVLAGPPSYFAARSRSHR